MPLAATTAPTLTSLVISALEQVMLSSPVNLNLILSPTARSFATFFVLVRWSWGASSSDTDTRRILHGCTVCPEGAR